MRSKSNENVKLNYVALRLTSETKIAWFSKPEWNSFCERIRAIIVDQMELFDMKTCIFWICRMSFAMRAIRWCECQFLNNIYNAG